MGDMREYWRDVKPYLKEKRKSHVARSGTSAQKSLEKLGYTFKHYESTQQFAIETPKGVIDYWGTTGTWIVRKTKNEEKAQVV